MTLPHFYPIVDSSTWVERVARSGARWVQLRMKERSVSTVRDEVLRSKQICASAGCQLVVNDYWKVAIEAECEWVHLGQGDLQDADLDAIRAAGLRLGVSTHDEAELERALSTQPEYVALGPVYPTTLKKMPWAPQGLERVTEWKKRVGSTPLVAIGGLSIERAPGVFEAGADSIAVVSDILLSADPEARVREWMGLKTRGPRGTSSAG